MLAGFAAYLIWGLFPLYWPLLKPAGAVEILAHRMIWSALSMAVVVVVLRRLGGVRATFADRRRLALLAGAAAVVSINWGTYIWGVNNGHVVETSLGYFINPLVTVTLGVVVLGERLRPLQWVAVAIALTAVLVLTLDYGRPPWIALVLAASFATYGLAKKKADTGAFESLTVETTLVAPFALAYAVWLASTGEATFGHEGAGHMALLVVAGVLTAIPLVLFGAAATRMSLVSLGLLQYLAPILQFSIGVLVFREDMPAARWAGFVLVWVALMLFTAESINHRRRQLALVADASAL
ncbi:EamA family transporter RarD [Nocardioides jishulii]|uniref:EamA family transporter RarD n=1 Tax=Nocardioides jishulii TaxID=2575440 RepID=A0A4U2YTP4_9ACTN|nr:EamA family transporter RarD [Nocardioides jishulii]TKI64926.1 EamA family transporter RarD [Nocardioides jishulii]